MGSIAGQYPNTLVQYKTKADKSLYSPLHQWESTRILSIHICLGVCTFTLLRWALIQMQHSLSCLTIADCRQSIMTLKIFFTKSKFLFCIYKNTITIQGHEFILSRTLGSSAKKLGLCGSTIEGYGSKIIEFLEEQTAALAIVINKSTT